MIPADIGAQLTTILRLAIAAGEFPPAAALPPAGSWRPVPAAPGKAAAGCYGTVLPFALAEVTGRPPAELAALLAGRLRGAPGIAAAATTGAGHLTVTVTGEALAALAPRIVAAGPYGAAPDGRARPRTAAAPQPDLRAARSWREAWRWQADAVTVRLAAAGQLLNAPGKNTSGAQSSVRPAAAGQPDAVRGPPGHQAPTTGGAGLGGAPVAAAIEYAGLDAVRYALTRTPARRAGQAGGRICVSRDRQNPFYRVLRAHADAAGTLRWAADLRLYPDAPDAMPALALSHPRERELLTELSWLPERVAGAARRRHPHEVAGYLEQLAEIWTRCREDCPALPFGGHAAPADRVGVAARLCLADATRSVLAAGLALIGVAAPQRL